MRYQALIFATNVSSVSISGKGKIDGNGGLWWKKHFANQLEWSRPPLVEIMYGDNIIVEDVTLQNSAFWSLHPYASTNIHVRNMQILSPAYSPNTDGVDVDSCKNVIIENCYFSLGDDGIAIKSGLDEAGRAFNMPSENIFIRNITVSPDFDNLSTNGISIGSEMSGGVRNVTVQDVFIENCESGLYVKSRYGRGGVVEDIHFENVFVRHTLQAIRLSMNYGYRRKRRLLLQNLLSSNDREEEDKEHESGGVEGGGAEDDDEGIPHFRNIYVSNLVGEDVAEAGFLYGLNTSTIENIVFRNVSISSKLGFNCRYVNGVGLDVSPSVTKCFRKN